ncbi:hypothetical protein Y1Q_0004826 [Alligator mississippiensis]|uniref:Uncharacterized protein n=1 Tax=Alligator mississippiensis TaxID=8496 RepID=A0A151NRU0_ALLMI|nr:hypothetical protein Y1Q_0004826 [Alligator mississippiensis]
MGEKPLLTERGKMENDDKIHDDGEQCSEESSDMENMEDMDKRVAMAIMKLASPSCLRYIMNQFSVAVFMVGLATC